MRWATRKLSVLSVPFFCVVRGSYLLLASRRHRHSSRLCVCICPPQTPGFASGAQTSGQRETWKVVDRMQGLGLHTILPAGFLAGVKPVGSTWSGAREVPLRQDVPRPGQCCLGDHHMVLGLVSRADFKGGVHHLLSHCMAASVKWQP